MALVKCTLLSFFKCKEDRLQNKDWSAKMSCWIEVNFGLKGNALCKITVDSCQDTDNVELAVFIKGCCNETLQQTD